MEGIYFYALAWLGWGIATFWMKRTAIRVYVAAIFLSILISSAFHFHVGAMTLSGSAIWILILTFGMLCVYKWRKTVYLIFCAGLVAMFFAAVRLVVLYDPIWFIKYKVCIVSVLVALLTLNIVQTFFDKIIVVCMGIIQGDILFALTLNKYHLYNEVGAFVTLDILMCSFAFLSMHHPIGKMHIPILSMKQKQMRERSKSL